jgi:hypothetical protein
VFLGVGWYNKKQEFRGVYAMKTMYSIMKKKKNKIPEDVLSVFHNIIQTCNENERDEQFRDAMNIHLTEEQRFRLWEQDGGCKGTGQGNERKAFAAEHASKPLPERLRIYESTRGVSDFGAHEGQIFLNDDNTITVICKCDACYRWAPNKEKFAASPVSYYGRCAGGRMYKLQQALGIKLRIKSIDVSPLGVNAENPCLFKYEIVEQ